MGMRSNLFENVENEFKHATKKEIIEIAKKSLKELFETIGDSFTDKAWLEVMILGAKLGVSGDGVINPPEKILIDQIFSEVGSEYCDYIYNRLGSDIEESDYELAQQIADFPYQMGDTNIALLFLRYVLSFAYIDGKFEDAVAERLDGLFGMNLMCDFFASGQEEESNSKNKIKVSKLEADIFDWFWQENNFCSLDDVAKHFKRNQKKDINIALQNLVNKKLLAYSDFMYSKNYSLNPEFQRGFVLHENFPYELVIDEESEVHLEELDEEDNNDDVGIELKKVKTIKENEQFKKLEDLVDTVDKVLDDLSEVTGIDRNPSNIGDTGYDMYNWTFTENKNVKGKGWSIAIPDGFNVIKSKERLFEAVPKGLEKEDNPAIQILAGNEGSINVDKDHWMHHPYARKGVAEVMGLSAAETVAQISGISSIINCDFEIVSCAFDDIMAYSLIQDTSHKSYNYQCNVITADKSQALRVVVEFVTEEQKKILTNSVLQWLTTFRFDNPNKACPSKTKFDGTACLNELLKGKFTKFEEAVKQAVNEYTIAINGNIKGLEYMHSNGLFDVGDGEAIKLILEKAIDVKLYFMQKADLLIDKLINKSAPSSVIDDAMQILSDFNDDVLEYEFDNVKTVIDLPKAILDIRDKWKKISPDAFNAKIKVKRDRIKGINERKKEREEREKEDEKFTGIIDLFCKRIKNVQRTFERNVEHHKRIIESRTFDGPHDSELLEFFSELDDYMQELGTDSEKLIIESIDACNKIIKFATPKVAISFIEAIEEAVEYVEGASICNKELDVNYKYYWDNDISELIEKLDDIKSTLKKREKEEKKQEEKDRKFEESQKYGVAEKDLNKHKKYIYAKERFERAKEIEDYEEVSDVLSKIDGYLDADKLKSECDEKLEKLKEIKTLKDEIDRASKICKELAITVNQYELEYNACVAEKDKAISDFNKRMSSYYKDKNETESLWDRNINELESNLSNTESRLLEARRNIENNNIELSKTSFIRFGKKKALRKNIAELNQVIISLEESVKDCKYNLNMANNNKIAALQKLDLEIKNMEKKNNTELEKVNVIEKKLSEARTKLTNARNELDEKKKKYDALI